MHPIIEKWRTLHHKYLYLDKTPFDFRTSELARHLGVSRRTVERWVEGKTSPKEAQLRAIDLFIKERGIE